MEKVTVVCHKDHDKDYTEYVGVCLLCLVQDLQQRIRLLEREVAYAENGYNQKYKDHEVNK